MEGVTLGGANGQGPPFLGRGPVRYDAALRGGEWWFYFHNQQISRLQGLPLLGRGFLDMMLQRLRCGGNLTWVGGLNMGG